MTGMMRVAVLSLGAALSGALLIAVPAHADANDDLFIQRLSSKGYVFENDIAKQGAIGIAKKTCSMQKAGYSDIEVTEFMVKANENVAPASAIMSLMGDGVMHYCPEVLAGVPLR